METDGKVLLPPSKAPDRKTLVLDLDETLVHATYAQEAQTKITLTLTIEDKTLKIYVNLRPGLQVFLERMAALYEVVVFTASLDKYADPLLNQIDSQSLISGRLFRESCSLHNGCYVKDLSRLGRDLKHVLILDVSCMQNSPNSYELQPNNAIPISSWFDDPEDKELFRIIPVLEQLASVEDVTQSILQTRKSLHAPLPPPIRPPEPFLDTPSNKSLLGAGKRRYRRRSFGGSDRGDYNSPVHAQNPNSTFNFEIS